MKITPTMKKLNITRILYLFGLSIFLILSSCQSSEKHKPETKIRNSSDDVKIEQKDNTDLNQKDSLSVQERFWENDEFHSHIKLDFAKTATKVEDTSQIRLIDQVCAISVIPDTSWINLQQEEYGEDWVEVVSDIQYYQYLATDTLEKSGIPILQASREKRYVKFIKVDKSSYTIDLTKMADAWGLLLFNAEDNPVFWMGTDIDRELKEIFKIN